MTSVLIYQKPTNRGQTYSLLLTSLRLLAPQSGSHLHQKRSLIISTQLTNSKNSQDTWRAINQLTNKHTPANTRTTSGISPDDLNNHFCSVASKVIKTDNSPINELTVLEQYCTEKISHEANALSFMTARGVYKSLCHLKQSNTKGTDGLDGKILRLSAPFIAETLTYIYI